MKCDTSSVHRIAGCDFLTHHTTVLRTILLIGAASAQTTLIPDERNGRPLADGCSFQTGEFGWHCFPLYIQYLANIIVGFTIAVCLLVIIYNGYRYAMGPLLGEGTNEGAKKGILFGLVGAGVALLAYLIIDAVFVVLTG